MASLISRRAYSSQVTHDFINSILARAQEATSKNKEVVNTSSASSGRFNNQRGRKSFNNRGNNNNGSYKGKRFQVKDENVANTRNLPSTNPVGVKAKQPQFRKSSRGNKGNGVQDNDMLDVLSSGQSGQRKVNGSNANNRVNARHKKSHVVGTVNVTKRAASPREIALRKPTDAATFEPFVPTPLSLLPFSTPIFNLPVNNILTASMKTLKESASSRNHLNNNYNAAKSGIIDKDSFLSSSKLDFDIDNLKSVVKGKYFELPLLGAKSFDKLTKKDDKKKELAKNGQVVRYALNANTLSDDKKQILYDVCTGLKPVSELSGLKE